MTTKQQIEKEIDTAMSSLDHLLPASPEPFFYTRLSARMMKEEKNIWGKLSRALTRPAIAGLSVVLIITINIFAVLHNSSASTTVSPDQSEMAMADEYNSSAALYIIDNAQP